MSTSVSLTGRVLASPLASVLLFAAPLASAQTAPAVPARAASLPATAGRDEVLKLDAFVSRDTRLDAIDPFQEKAFLSPSVVEVVSHQDLVNTGALDLTVALDKLLPSFTWPPSYNSGNAVTDIKTVQMRGTSPVFSLVLVNGKRFHRSSRPTSQNVDINQIPISAVARIEVVRDGTSTIYGGDAVASAINIVLKDDPAGGQLNYRLGQYHAGDGINRSGNASVGTRLGRDGFLRVSVDFLNKQGTDRSGPNLNQIADGRPEAATRDRWGDGRTKSHHAWINAELPLTGALRAYAFGGYGYSDGRAGNQPQRWWVAANDVNRYPDGHQPIASTVTDDITAVGGLRYADEGLGKFDLAYTYGWAKGRDYSYDSVSVSYGAQSQKDFFRGAYYNEENILTLDWEKRFDRRLARPVTVLAGASYRNENYYNRAGDEQSWAQGPVKITYDPRNGQPRVAPAGNTGQKGLRAEDVVDITSRVHGAYAGLDTRLAPQLQVGGVFRYERYSAAGSVGTLQASARYDFSRAIALRGSAGTAFSPPVAAQIGSVGNSLDDTTGQWTRRLAPTHPVALALGATPLEPATSENYGLGVVLKPTDRLSLSIDAYEVSIDNQVVTTTTLTGALVRQLFAAQGDPDTTGVNFFTNGFDTRHRGLETNVKYTPRLPEGAGHLRLSAAFSLMQNKVVGLRTRDPNIATTALFDVQATIRNTERVKPRKKLVLGATYTLGRWDFAPKLFYYGNTFFYRAPTAQLIPPLNDLEYKAAWIANASIGYRYSPKLRFSIGSTNLANKLPEKTPFPNSGLDQYGHTVAYGSAGAFYYTSVDYKF